MPRRFRGVSESFLSGHRIELLRNGAEAFPEMLSAIDQAERQVLLEMYWFSGGRVGQRFAAALARAARRNVEVALLYDSVGSWDTDRGLFDDLRRAGGHVIEFGPLMPWQRRFRLEHLTRRDHRKLLVVDGAIGFTGGINISDEWLPAADGGGGWRDDVVRFQGPSVAELAARFEATWRDEGGAALASRTHGGVALKAGQQDMRILGEAYYRHRRQIVRAYISQIYHAEHRVWITNPYFVPARVVLRALLGARRRGVDVRILVPEVSDMPFVQLASRAVWERLLVHGVRIFQWRGAGLHAKSAVIDGVWATTGTFNLDYRSQFTNIEVNVAVRDVEFARAMEASFEDDLLYSREVSYSDFRQRPWRERFMERLCHLFRRFL